MLKHATTIRSVQWPEQDAPLSYAVGIPDRTLASSTDVFADQTIHLGQFAVVQETAPSTYEAIRDPLGIGKLFYTTTGQGLQFAVSFVDLLSFGTPIYSLPRGCHVRIGFGGERSLIRRIDSPDVALDPIRHYVGTPEGFSGSEAGQLFRQKVRARLDQVFTVIRDLEAAGYTILIALSGGLDSSIIASLSHRSLKAPVACTLDLGRSEDAEKSALIARELGIRHVIFQTCKEEILDGVKEAPVLCQDFRDFNVHCAALNILLARKIAAFARADGLNPDKLIVLTGDLMNEFTNDYAEEVIDGHRYYRLPRVAAKPLQKHLIAGLDTSDREVLPFRKYGIQCIQPYSAVYDLYATIPGAILDLKDVKKILNSFLVAPQIMDFLPKSKLRAQVGSKESMGVLGLCHAMKIDEAAFLDDILAPTRSPKERIPIFMGRYQTEEFQQAGRITVG